MTTSNTNAEKGTNPPEGGLTEVKPGIYEINGLKFPGLAYGISGASRDNLSCTHAAGREDLVVARRVDFANDLGINPEKVVQMNIKQSDTIAVVTSENAHSITNNDDSLILPETDAMITNEPGVALWLVTADCLSIILFDRVKKVLALVHVGRKGAALDLPAKVVSKMAEEFDCRPTDIVAGIGPAIGPECYIYKELPIEHQTPFWEQYIEKTEKGYGINFVGYSVDSLKALGVKVFESKHCVSHQEGFFSHNKSSLSVDPKLPQKRFATLVTMK